MKKGWFVSLFNRIFHVSAFIRLSSDKKTEVKQINALLPKCSRHGKHFP